MLSNVQIQMQLIDFDFLMQKKQMLVKRKLETMKFTNKTRIMETIIVMTT